MLLSVLIADLLVDGPSLDPFPVFQADPSSQTMGVDRQQLRISVGSLQFKGAYLETGSELPPASFSSLYPAGTRMYKTPG